MPISDLFTRPGQTQALTVYNETANHLGLFPSWLGAPLDMYESQLGHWNSGAGMSGQKDAANAIRATAVAGGITLPNHWSAMISEDGHTLAEAAAGFYDNNSNDNGTQTSSNGYKNVARAILACHNQPTGSILVRLAQEFNGSWFAWRVITSGGSTSGGSAADFITAWQRCVNAYRTVSNRFLFEWNIAVGWGSPGQAYPGDAYVDIVSMDSYAKPEFWGGGDQQASYWNNQKTHATSGYDWLVNFANTHGKSWGVTEYGVQADSRSGDITGSPPYNENIPMTTWLALHGKYCRDNGAAFLGYWDANSGAFAGRLSENSQYPLTGAEYKKQNGFPLISSGSSSSATAGAAFAMTLTATLTDHISWSLPVNPGGFTVAGTTLQHAPAAGGTYTCTVRATSIRGLTTDQSFTLTVTGGSPATVGSVAQTEQGDTLQAAQSAFVDLWPAYDGYFDPVHGSYKVAGVVTNSLAIFLGLSQVHFAADPTAGFSAAGYLPAEAYNLYLELPPISTWSVYVEAATVVHVAGNYENLFVMRRAVETTSLLQICKDGFSSAPQQARSGVRDAGAAVGIDTNFFAIPASGDFKVAMTASATAIKFFGQTALGYTNVTTLFGAKPFGRIEIGDMVGPTNAFWPGRIKLLRWKYTADADATVLAAMSPGGSSAITEQNDTIAATATISIGSVVGSVARTEANDTGAAAAALAVAAALARAEGNDTSSSLASLAIVAALGLAEAADAAAALASIQIGGITAATEAPDTLFANTSANTTRLGVNAILLTTNLQDTGFQIPPVDMTDIADNPMLPDTDWWTAVNPLLPVSVRLGFASPAQPLIGNQRFRVWVRKTGGHDPRVTIALVEAGVTIRNLVSSYSVSSLTGELIEVVWNANEISDLSGADVELQIFVEA